MPISHTGIKQCVILFLMLECFICLGLHATAGAQLSQVAFIVGIDQYAFWPPLEAGVSDANYVGKFLRGNDYEVVILRDREATRSNIIRHLQHFSSQRAHRFMFYFAGHGHTVENGTHQKGYIVPVNARLNAFDEYAISFLEIKSIIESFHAKHILLIFDSCYSGLALTRAGFINDQSEGYLKKVDAQKSCQVLTAGQKGDQAVESQGHGVFTRSFINALKGEADSDKNNILTTTEICAWLRPIVYNLSDESQLPMYGRLFGEGEYLFNVRGSNSSFKTQHSWYEESKRIYRRITSTPSAYPLFYGKNASLLKRISAQLDAKRPEVKSFIQNAINYQITPSFYSRVASGTIQKNVTASNRANDKGVAAYHRYRKSGNSNDLNQSIKHYQDAIFHNPENASAYSNLSLSYRRTREYRKAIWAGLRSIELTDKKSTVAASLYNIGACYNECRQKEGALVFYLSALSLRKKESKTYRITDEKISNIYAGIHQ